MTPDDIRNVTFEQGRKGYRPEDVDDFLQQVAADVEKLKKERDALLLERDSIAAERDTLAQEKAQIISQGTAEAAAAIAAKEEAEAKMYVLAEKVEEYRGQEDTLKTALINAQRMGETVVKEAKIKADQMLHDATGQSELLRQKAEMEITRERDTLENMLGEVNKFKTTILNLYKQHIESLSALDGPTTRAEEVLEQTEKYSSTEGELSPSGDTPMGAAAPEIPAAGPVLIPENPAPEPFAYPEPAAPAQGPAYAEPQPQYQPPQPEYADPAYQTPYQPQAGQPVFQQPTPAGDTIEYTVPDVPKP